MLKVRIKESYPNQFWNSGDGFTIAKADRVGKWADEDNYIIRSAINQGFLEVVEESDEKTFIKDTAPEGIKEIVTPKNTAKIKEALKRVTEDEANAL